ncbi:Hypothetical predicted protein [Paramuricea clavata]|uniref:Uncharacterized protein n=1 Tax=Paramuricea clavata TaxID=317549 RepID=A0A6S7JQL5_PARCT|nr:Hypothetical predicted protein [Paramuricea clavata]
MAQPFQNIRQRPFEAQTFRRNFGNNFDTVVVSGFSRYIRAKQIVDFFILKEGDCVCVSTKSDPPSVLLRFSSPVVAENVVLRYNNADVYGQKLKVFPSNNWHSVSPQISLQSAEIPPLMGNNAHIPTPKTPSRRVQAPSFLDVQPVIGTSILNLALLIQKNNLNASNNSIVESQWKSQTRSPQRNFPPSRRSPPDNQQRNVTDRRSACRPSDIRAGRVQRNADKDPTSNRRDKNTLVKKQETAQKVSHTEKCPKDQGIKRNEEIKGPVVRRRRLGRRNREKDIERAIQTAVSKDSSRVVSSAGKNMNKSDSSSLQKTPHDVGKEKPNCSTNNNKNNETGIKATIEKPFDGCKINTEGNEKTKPKEDGASVDGVKSKSTASAKENPASQGIGSKKECPTRVNCKKDKGGDKTTPKDSGIENEKRAGGVKDKSGEKGTLPVTQGTASKQKCPMGKSDNKDNESCHTPTRKDSVLENESPKGSVKSKSGEKDILKSSMSSESETKCPTNKSNDTYIGKGGNEITKKDSIIENESTNAKNKGRETESRKSTMGFASEKKFVTRKNGDKTSGDENRKKTAKDLVIESKSASDGIMRKSGEGKSQQSMRDGEKGEVSQRMGPNDSATGNERPANNNKDRNVESRKSTQDFDQDCLTTGSNSENDEPGRNLATYKRCSTTGNVKQGQKDFDSKTYAGMKVAKNDKKCSWDDNKNTNIGSECRPSTSKSGSEKKYPSSNINDAQHGKQVTASTNASKSHENVKGGDVRSTNFSTDKNLGTTQDSSGNKGPIADNDKRNAETRSEIVSTQNKSANNNKSSVKTDPQNSNVKNRSQTVKSPQNLPNGKKPSLENQQKKDEKGLKKTGLKKTSDRSSSKDNKLKQANDSPTAAQRNPTQRNSTTSKLAKNNGGKAKPKSSVSKKDVARERNHRFMINARGDKRDSFGRNHEKDSIRYRKRLDESSPQPRSFSPYRNRISPPRDSRVFEGNRSPDRTTLRNNLVRSSDEVRSRKRAFEAAGLVVAPPKRKCLNKKSTGDNKDKMDPKKVIDTTFEVTGLVLAPPKKMCLDDQSTRDTDINGPEKVGSPNEFVPKKVIDTAFKATGLVVAPPKGKCLHNKSSGSNNNKMGTKRLFGLKDLRDVVIEKNSEKRYGTLKGQKNNNQKGGDGIRRGKQSDTKNISTRKNQEGKESIPVEISAEDSNLKRRDCLNFDKGQAARDALENSTKDSSKNLEDRGLAITKTSAKDATQKSGDGSNLATVQSVSDILKTSDTIEDSSMQKKPENHAAKTSVGDTTARSNDCTNSDKLQLQGNALQYSDLMKDSSNNLEKKELTMTKCSSEQDYQGSSNCTDLDKEEVASHKLENFKIWKESSTQKKPEDNGLTIAKKCSEYFCQKINDGTNFGKVEPAGDAMKFFDSMKNSTTRKKSDDKGLTIINSSLEQSVQKSSDGSSLYTIQVAGDSLKNPESINNMSTPNTPRDRETSLEHGSSKQSIFPKGDNQNKIKESDRESPILINQGHDDMKENLTKEKNSLEKNSYSKIPVSPCTAVLSTVLSLNFSISSENSFGVEGEHTTSTERNSDTCKASLAADITQRNMTNNGNDKLKCSSFNTDSLKDSIQRDIEVEAGDRNQIQDENFEQERNPSKGDVEENVCHVDQVSQCVGAFSTVITTTDQSENENSNQSESLSIPKMSDEEPLKDDCVKRNVFENQKSLPTVSKTVPSKTTTLGCTNSGITNSKFMLAKLKTLKTNAQKTSRIQDRANVATSEDRSISVKINSASNSSQQENETTSPNNASESKSEIVEDRIVKSAETQSELATVSKYFACMKIAIDQKSDAGVSDAKLKPSLMEISGPNKDCSNSNHKNTDVEQQPVITCDSAKKADDNFPNSTPTNKILPELEEVAPSISRKSLKPQSERRIMMIRVAKSDVQKVDKDENEENETQKSAEPKNMPVGANVPDNMQKPVESKTRMSACISETVKESKHSEVFSQENTSNVVSEEHVAEQPKVVCDSIGSKSSSGVAFLRKSTTITIAPALLATEEVKRFKTDVLLVTEDHPMCVTNNSEKYFHNLSTIDLQNNNIRIASTSISDVKKETQLQNEPTSAKDNSSFQNNASENNQGKELTNVTCDSFNANESASQVPKGLFLTTITHDGSDCEVKRVKIEKTSPPKDNLEGKRYSLVDIHGRPNCDSINSDKTTPLSENPTSTTSTAIFSDFKTMVKLNNIEETLTKNDQEYSIDDKRCDSDFQKTKDNLGNSKKSVSTNNAKHNSSATTNNELVCGKGTIMSSGNSSVKKCIINTNIVKIESKERYLEVDRGNVLKNVHTVTGSSIEKDPVSVLGETELVRCSSTLSNTCESKKHLIQQDRQDVLKNSQNGVGDSSDGILNASSIERNPIPVLGEPRLVRSSSTNSRNSKDILMQGDMLNVSIKYENNTDCSSETLSNLTSMERKPIPVLGEPRLVRSSSTNSLSANTENQSLLKPTGPSLQNHTRNYSQCAGVNAQGRKSGKRKITRRKENKNRRKKRLRRMQNQQQNQGAEDNVQCGKAVGNNGSVQQQNCEPESLKQVFRMRCKDYTTNVENFAQNLSLNESSQEILQDVFQSGCFGDLMNDENFGQNEKGVSQNGTKPRLEQSSQEEVPNNDGNLVQNSNGVSQYDIEQNVNCSIQSTEVVLKHASQSQSTGDAIKQAFQTVSHEVNNDERSVQNVQSSQDELKLSSQIGCQKVNSCQNSVQSDTFNNASDRNYDFSGNENALTLINKDFKSGCHNVNGGNSVQSGASFSDNGRGNLNYPSASCQDILNQASQSGCESLSNGGSSVQNDGQDVNLTGDTAIAGKRKREDEPADVAGNKHQKCLNPSQKKNLNELQSNQSNEQAAGVEGMKLSGKERNGQEQERRFLWENILTIEEQYDKESVALLRNVKMLASMDPSLTEKLKGAFRDSLTEIGRKYLLDLHKLKVKNDSYKNQHKLAKGNNVPPKNPKNIQSTDQGKTQNQRKMIKAKTPQSKPGTPQKKGKGNVNQTNPTKKQQGTGKAVDNGETNNQQKMAKGEMAENKTQKKSQMKGNMPRNEPQNTPKGDNSQRNPHSQYNMIRPVGKIGPTNNKQNMVSGQGK